MRDDTKNDVRMRGYGDAGCIHFTRKSIGIGRWNTRYPFGKLQLSIYRTHSITNYRAVFVTTDNW